MSMTSSTLAQEQTAPMDRSREPSSLTYVAPQAMTSSGRHVGQEVLEVEGVEKAGVDEIKCQIDGDERADARQGGSYAPELLKV